MSRFVPAIPMIAFLVRAAAAQQGQLDASPTLFTVMAAVNAAGFDQDLNSPNNSPLRKALREELVKRDIPSLANIKEFVAKHHLPRPVDDYGQYVSFALTAGPPPGFLIQKRDVDIPPEVLPLRDFSDLLSSFYKEANIEEWYKRAQPEIDRLIEPYHQPVIDTVLQVNSYLRQTTSGFRGRHFQVFFDPLGPPSQIQSRSYANEYTVVITPSPRPHIAEVRHAYLTYLLDPLATRNEEILNRKKPLADHAARAKLLGDAYKTDFLLLVTSSLVRAVEARMDHTPDSVQKALREGYILTPYFYEALATYQKQEQSMMLYYSTLVGGIDLYQEDRRLVPVDFIKDVPEAAPKPAAPGKNATPPVYDTLKNAEESLKKEDMERAEKLFSEASKQTENKHAQAAGFYGLGRVSLAKDEPDDAEAFMETVLTLEPEASIKAWSLVYLGKLRLEVSDRERASQYFKAVLEVEGATEAARNEARQGLTKILNK